MDFGFSEEQREVQQLARQILADQVNPERLAAFDEYAAPRFDSALWQTLLDAGLPGVAVDTQYGGMGFGFMELALLLEEVGRHIAPVPMLAQCVGAMLTLQRFAPPALCERWLPAALRGECLLSAALPAVTGPALQAESDGDELVLQGSLAAVPFAAQAERVLVGARLDGDVALVLLDPRAPGVRGTVEESTSFEPQMRLQAEQVRVAEAEVVMRSRGAEALNWLRERWIAALCAQQLGTADAAMRLTAGYTGERQQFGVPISTFQAVGHRMANCYIDVECLRLATYQAASLLHDELPAGIETRIAKVWAGDTGHRVSYATQHVHGGTGIDRDYPLWRFCLWLRHNEMTLGSSTEHLAGLGRQLAAGEGLFT